MASRSEHLEGDHHHYDTSVDRSWPEHVWGSICCVLVGGRIRVLLPFGPLAIFINYYYTTTAHPGWVFCLSLLGITPLAERLGYATEQIAYYTGPTVGGLLNATFGNATEMIVSIFALKSGMISVVQQSLLGSILSNLLMVLGCAFFIGGIVHQEKKVQAFNKAAAIVDCGLLLVGVMVIMMFQLVLQSTNVEVKLTKLELSLSRFSSCIMLLAYGVYLFFQLKSHQNLYNPIYQEDILDEESNCNMEEDMPEITKWEAISWLAILTIWVSLLSEQLVDAIQGASESLNLPMSFINVILVPIAGNSAAYATTIMFAIKDKLDITLGVAIGSSTQIAMFAIPFYVVVGWIVNQPMDLNFQLFETATLFITVVIIAYTVQAFNNGSSWGNTGDQLCQPFQLVRHRGASPLQERLADRRASQIQGDSLEMRTSFVERMDSTPLMTIGSVFRTYLISIRFTPSGFRRSPHSLLFLSVRPLSSTSFAFAGSVFSNLTLPRPIFCFPFCRIYIQFLSRSFRHPQNLR